MVVMGVFGVLGREGRRSSAGWMGDSIIARTSPGRLGVFLETPMLYTTAPLGGAGKHRIVQPHALP